MAAIEARGLGKRYAGGVVGLRGLDIAIQPGELVGLLGASGSGKTTLFRLLIGALRPTSGSLTVLGEPLERAHTAALRRVRRRLALVYQQHNLVPGLSVAQNVLLGRLGRVPLWHALGWLVHLRAAERRAVFDVLASLGVADKFYARVDELSGGQQQRVAVARALLDPPEVLLADEPVASVDATTATVLLDQLVRLNRERGTTVLLSLHQAEFARRYCPRVLVLADGVLVYDGPPEGRTGDALTPAPSPSGRGEDVAPAPSTRREEDAAPAVAPAARGGSGEKAAPSPVPPLPLGEAGRAERERVRASLTGESA